MGKPAKRGAYFIGILFILAGVFILFNEFRWQMDIGAFRSYGLLLLGGLLFLRALSRSDHRGIFLASALTLSGLFFTLGEMALYPLDNGLITASLTLIVGLSFLLRALLGRLNWWDGFWAIAFMTLSVFFYLFYLGYVPDELFITIFDDYWPVGLILIGVAYLLNALTGERRGSALAEGDSASHEGSSTPS